MHVHQFGESASAGTFESVFEGKDVIDLFINDSAVVLKNNSINRFNYLIIIYICIAKNKKY